ncbi:MAG: copper resistance protein CopC [Actinomycetota bacterium]|nr:copper resistance protein CopC [Actinomycetota bacterium]
MRTATARLAFGGASALVLLAIATGPARAHAEFKDSVPGEGSTIDTPPSRVVASFTEPPDGASRLVVLDPCGDRADRGPTQTAGTQLSVATTDRYAGVYSVQYNVLSDLDGHPERGSFSFRVEQGEECGAITAADETAAEGSLFDLPFGAFAFGLLCAALIGSAAGYVYVATGRR